MGLGESGGIEKVDSERDLPSQRNPGKPNTRYDYYKKGKLDKSRWTDSNGQPTKDRHYTDHGNPKMHPNVPHDHSWINGELSSSK